MTDENSKPVQADWAPGTLDKTRQAIGKIDPKEAEAMAQNLEVKSCTNVLQQHLKIPQINQIKMEE